MSVFESITGNPYTIDPDFAVMRGRVVGKQTVEHVDHRRNVTIRTTRTLIDIGRPDPIEPADPDRTIAHEGPQALGFKPVKRTRTSDLLERVYEVLAERTFNSTQLATATGESTARIRGLIRNHPEGFEVVARGLYGNVYGLPGHSYAEPVYHGSMRAIVDYLREHGPSTAPAICAALGIVYSTFTNARNANPGVVRVVGVTEARSSAQIWGLAA